MPAIAVFTSVDSGEGGSGRIRDEIYDLTFVTDGVNANYTVGGIALAPRQAGGLLNVVAIDPIGHANAAGTAVTDIFILSWDFKRQRLQLFGDAVAGTGLNELAAVDISGITFRVRVVGQ